MIRMMTGPRAGFFVQYGKVKENPRLFSYVVRDDTGLAPNPYWDFCTLAVCKPQIRATAKEGDLVIGLAPRKFGYRLLYTMKVEESLSFDEYYRDDRFTEKIPDMFSGDPKLLFGDNFYRLDEGGQYEQMWSSHSNADGTEDREKSLVDLGGRNVLVAKVFYYYGENGKILPENLDFLQVGRGHRCNFTDKEVLVFLRYLDRMEPGIWGEPKDLQRNLQWLKRVWSKKIG